MGVALEMITAQVTAPGATFVAGVALAGDSLVVRNTGKRVSLVAAWQQQQAGALGSTRITSPLLHDNTRGIQYGLQAGSVEMGLYGQPVQQLFSQDGLVISRSGSAVAGDIEQSSLLVRYDDLPGIDGNFISFDEAIKRTVNRLGVRVTPLVAVATGQYSAGVAINAVDDSLKANTEYAVIGFTAGAQCTSIGIKSPDWGNLRVGAPGMSGQSPALQDFFLDLSYETGLGCVPVFNSSNKGQTLVDFCDDENAANITVVAYLAELSARRGR